MDEGRPLGQGCLVLPKPRDALLFPGQCTAWSIVRDLTGADGAGDRASAAFPGGGDRQAGRSGAQPGCTARRNAKQRNGLHSRPTPLSPLRKASVDTGGHRPGGLKIYHSQPRNPARATRFYPPRWELGRGIVWSAPRPALTAAAVAKCTPGMGMGPCKIPPRSARAHTSTHTHTQHTPCTRTPHSCAVKKKKLKRGASGRRAGYSIRSEAPGRWMREKLTCKQAVLVGSGLLDHDVDILLNAFLP